MGCDALDIDISKDPRPLQLKSGAIPFQDLLLDILAVRAVSKVAVQKGSRFHHRLFGVRAGKPGVANLKLFLYVPERMVLVDYVVLYAATADCLLAKRNPEHRTTKRLARKPIPKSDSRPGLSPGGGIHGA